MHLSVPDPFKKNINPDPTSHFDRSGSSDLFSNISINFQKVGQIQDQVPWCFMDWNSTDSFGSVSAANSKKENFILSNWYKCNRHQMVLVLAQLSRWGENFR